MIVETATDSRNRTAGNIRHYFDKCGGNLGVGGCVSFMFTDMGLITIEDEDGEIDEEALMEAALEAGAADFTSDEGVFEITTELSDLEAIAEAIRAAGFPVTTAEATKIPSSYVTIEDEAALANMEKMLDYFDEDEDITAVYHNWEN